MGGWGALPVNSGYGILAQLFRQQVQLFGALFALKRENYNKKRSFTDHPFRNQAYFFNNWYPSRDLSPQIAKIYPVAVFSVPKWDANQMLVGCNITFTDQV